ncbi:MAG: hypothetical protein FWG65_09660 [Turicibacter sp.]|nr:hypothetical protein [Turicibacter sp.]
MTKTTERIWLNNTHLHYPDQWIVAVQVEIDPNLEMFNPRGEIYAVVDTKEDAHSIRLSLGDSMGKIAIIKGIDRNLEITGVSTASGQGILA